MAKSGITIEASPNDAAAAAVAACCTPGLSKPMPREDAERMAAIVKAVAHPARLQLLSIIKSSGEACACDLTEPVGLSQPTVSHHLKILTEAGLIEREQRGTWAWFSVNSDRLRDLGQLFSPSS